MGSSTSTCRQGSASSASTPSSRRGPPAPGESRANWDEAMACIQAGQLPNVALTGQGLRPEAIAELCQALKGNTSVKALELDNNQVADAGAIHIGEIIAADTAIRFLDLSNNGIFDAGAKKLAEGLQANSTLYHLEFCSNRFQSSGASALAKMLGANISLRQLGLSDNKVGPVGGRSMAPVIGTHPSLRILNLRNCCLGPEGTKAIANGLTKESTVLTELSLGLNRMADVGAQEIAGMIKVNQSIKELYMDQNNIGDKGGSAIADALRDNHSLQTLWMVRNDLNSKVVEKFAGTIYHNKTLRRLGITSKNKLPPHVRQAMQNARQKRRGEDEMASTSNPLPPLPGKEKRKKNKKAPQTDPDPGGPREPEPSPADDFGDEDDDLCPIGEMEAGAQAMPRTARAGKQGVSRGGFETVQEILWLDDHLQIEEVPREMTNMSAVSSAMPIDLLNEEISPTNDGN